MSGGAGPVFGRVASLDPTGQAGLTALMSALHAKRLADWNAMGSQIGHLNDAMGSNAAMNAAIQAGDAGRAAADLDMARIGGGLGDSVSGALAGRGAAMRDPAMAAVQSIRDARATERGPTRGPDAFRAARAARNAAASMRTDARRGFDRSREAPRSADARLREAASQAAFSMGRANDRGELARTIAGIRARPHAFGTRTSQWQASQVRPEYSPLWDWSHAFAPRMIRGSLAKAQVRRRRPWPI